MEIQTADISFDPFHRASGNGHAQKNKSAIRLNLGAGDKPLGGYLNLDRKHGNEICPLSENHSAEDGSYVRIQDCSVDEIRASHVLEHFGHRQTLDVLKEWVRVLKPGGILKIAVPDFDKISDWYTRGVGQELPLEQYLMGSHSDENDHHGAIFNEQKLTQLMHLAGVGEIQRWESEIEDCAKLQVSLNLTGIKGAGKFPNLRGKVAACFSMPRLAFTDNMFCAMRTLAATGISAIRKSGVFWGQALQGCFELTIDTAPYILTIDYDSVFKPEDVVALYRVMEQHPEADAVCSIQSGRERTTPLMTVSGADGKNRAILDPEEMANDLLELRTGHFGLTMLRTSSLRKLGKPWFMHKPDQDGGWGDGRVDDDIYFWLKWREAGLRLFQANRIVVGHAQMVISWPDRHLETIHQYAPQWESEGKPENAWR